MIEIKSDATLPEAVEILAHHNLFSAPVVDVDAPEGASWIDRYIGIVEFAGIAVWILHQVGIPIYMELTKAVRQNKEIKMQVDFITLDLVLFLFPRNLVEDIKLTKY